MSLWLTIGLWCLAGGMGLWLLVTMIRSGRPIRQLLGGALQGACALAAVNVTGMFTGVSLGLNLFTAGVCGALGIPGVVTLLFLRVIFGS